MSIADILDIRVSTVSRIPEESMTVPAALYVITHDDIRRSGATSIPEALRLAPGLEVARIDGGTWSVGIRGFADRLARSMLVLIDGRAVYSPLFAGTYWETQDVLLEDVDRIEVIRGPGGTLWGANAVNGIINIVTKAAKDTQGWYATGAGGSQELADGALRYGGTSGSASYRLYAKAEDRGAEFHPNGNDFDGFRGVQGGGRVDWTTRAGRAVTLQGDMYEARLGEQSTQVQYAAPFSLTTDRDAPLSGGNLLARVNSAARARAPYQLQVYYDRTNRDEIPAGEKRDTFDVDFQQSWSRLPRQQVVWGGGYRVSDGRITAVPPTAFTPNARTDNLFTGFAQDEITLVPDRWRVTVGSKIEHNDYTGVEVQPSVRVAWTPSSVATVWAGVTRAVRTPSRVETDYTTTSLVSAAGTPTFVRLVPDPSFQAEKLVAYETGVRAQPSKHTYIAVSTFYNALDDTLSTDLQSSFIERDAQSTRLILPVTFANGLHGDSYGAELTADMRVTPFWRLNGTYSYLNVAMTRDPGDTDVSQEKRYEGLIPHHQVQVTSSLDVHPGWSVDWFVRYTSTLAMGPIPGYTTSDLRVAWQVSPQWEFSVVGQDLLHDHIVEWPGSTQIARSAYVRLTWRRR
jgi:iron complex outermembrane receptor protein